MENLNTVQKKLDKVISQTLTELKIETISNIIIDLNSYNQLTDCAITIEISEKKMRDCNYDPEQCFKVGLTTRVQANETSFSLKEMTKDTFMFAMKYQPLSINMDLHAGLETYNANEFLNEVLKQGFIDNNKINFMKVVKNLEQKGEDISTYKYTMKNYNKAKEEAQYQQRLLEVNQEFWFRNSSHNQNHATK